MALEKTVAFFILQYRIRKNGRVFEKLPVDQLYSDVCDHIMNTSAQEAPNSNISYMFTIGVQDRQISQALVRRRACKEFRYVFLYKVPIRRRRHISG